VKEVEAMVEFLRIAIEVTDKQAGKLRERL